MNKAIFTTSVVVMLGSCASAFPYKWYGVDPARGILLGKTEVEDIPLTTCQPDDVQKGKCAVLLIEEFERLRTDYATLKERLKQCEQK